MERTLFTDSTGQDRVLNLRFHRGSRIRYRADSLEELMTGNWELLKHFINHHKLRQAPRIQELMDYARGENHDVLKSGRRKDKEMADKRAVHNYGRMISKFKTGYLAGNPIRVEYDDNNDHSQNDEAIKRIGRINDIDTHNRTLIRDLSQTGRAYELIYRSEYDETRIKRLNPLDTFVIYDNSLEDNSIAAVRYYKRGSLESAKEVVEVYTPEYIYTLDVSDSFSEISVTAHAFGTVPITEFLNNVDGIGDYETELYLIDLYDSAESDTANHMSDMADAILAIYGDLALPQGMKASDMKRTRLMQLKPPKSADGKEGTVKAEYLTKSYDVTGVEAYKTRLNKDIHVFTNTPDMSDTNFSGNTSGEALKYKLFGLDQDRIDTQSQFTKGLKRRYRLAARIGSLVNEFKDFDESLLNIIFTPNLPRSLAEQVEVLAGLGGQVSQETALSLSGLVESPTEELDRMNREVSEVDIKGFESKARRYVAEKDFSATANEELRNYNFSMSVGRRELLIQQLELELMSLAEGEEKLMREYLNTAYKAEMARGSLLDQSVLKGNILAHAMETAVNANFEGAKWSERVWGRNAQLRQLVRTEVTRALIRGDNGLTIARRIRKHMDVSRTNAERLGITEHARVQALAQQDIMKENGFEYFKLMPESRACSICKGIGEETEKNPVRIADMEIGKNAPPIHPYCRCAVAEVE